jgi:hypothetical protein
MALGGVGRQVGRKEALFFEKKKQKTFVHLGSECVGCVVLKWLKVFLLLFLQKKKMFSFVDLPGPI